MLRARRAGDEFVGGADDGFKSSRDADIGTKYVFDAVAILGLGQTPQADDAADAGLCRSCHFCQRRVGDELQAARSKSKSQQRQCAQF